MDEQLMQMGKNAAFAKYELQLLTSDQKNQALYEAAEALKAQSSLILEENSRDMVRGKEKGMSPGLLDRLRLTRERIEGMAQGLEEVAQLPDPVGEQLAKRRPPNGLKSGNAVILKGGSDAVFSNSAIAGVIQDAIYKSGITRDALQLIKSTDREITRQFMGMKEYVDLLIPRGGAGLIRSVVENSTIPVIETGTGNCHIFVDEYADLEKAVSIIVNAKTQRIGVCNACESLVIHEKIVDDLLPRLARELEQRGVEIRGDQRVQEVIGCKPAAEEDYATEYLDLIISMKTVSSVEEAIAHINQYSTRHSESIITENKENGEKFLREIDAACVYLNASTRFTDGFEFGFGA